MHQPIAGLFEVVLQEPLQHTRAHHGRPVGEGSPPPAEPADVEEVVHPVEQRGGRQPPHPGGLASVRHHGVLERLDPSGEPRVAARDAEDHPEQLDPLRDPADAPAAPGQVGRACLGLRVHPHEVVEHRREQVAERGHPQHRVDVAHVVVQPLGVHLHQVGERLVHRFDPPAGEAVRPRDGAEVVPIAGAGDGLQQGAHGAGVVLVDVRVRVDGPLRRDRARLQQPDGLAVPGPLDVLWAPPQGRDATPQGQEIGHDGRGQQRKVRGLRQADAMGHDPPRDQRLARASAVLEAHAGAVVGVFGEEDSRYPPVDLALDDDAHGLEAGLVGRLIGQGSGPEQRRPHRADGGLDPLGGHIQAGVELAGERCVGPVLAHR